MQFDRLLCNATTEADRRPLLVQPSSILELLKDANLSWTISKDCGEVALTLPVCCKKDKAAAAAAGWQAILLCGC